MPSTIIILIAWDLYGLKALSLLAGLMLVLILMVCIRFWRIKAGQAFYAAAKFAPSDDIRARHARKGVLAGNKEARLLYIFSSPASFSGRRPHAAFKVKKIPCVFSGFYFPARYRKHLSVPQLADCSALTAFPKPGVCEVKSK